MTTTYTNVNKASGTSYTNVSTGAFSYDDPTVAYDDSAVDYDGVFNTYTTVNKATGTTYTNIPKAT